MIYGKAMPRTKNIQLTFVSQCFKKTKHAFLINVIPLIILCSERKATL